MLTEFRNKVLHRKYYQFASLLSLACCIGWTVVSVVHDGSSSPMIPLPEFSPKRESLPRKIFVSGKFAADERFMQHLNWFRNIVEDAVVFESENIHIYSKFPDCIMNDTRWTNHLEFLHNPRSATARGAGYWFWKSVLIGHHLSELRDGDFLVYTDADIRSPLSYLKDLFVLMEYRDADLSLYLTKHLERVWAKRDVYDKLCPGVDPAQDTSRSYAANFMVLRKTSATVRFIKEWEKYVEDLHVICDEPSVLPNIPEYREHRHDQTVLNMLFKCHWYEPYKAIVSFPANHTAKRRIDQVDLQVGEIVTFSLWKSLELHPAASIRK